MSLVARVDVVRRSLGAFAEVIGEERLREGMEAAAQLRDALGERAIWNVNSTAVGGGVAEMLRPLLGYTRGAGIDARWAVIGGDPDFFRVTKRLHHALHGSRGDGAALDEAARAIYEKTLAENAAELLARIRRGDLVLLHDPQTAGLAPALLDAGAIAVWRCHIGADVPSAEAAEGWRFLEPYLADVSALVFSRPAYVPPWCDGGRVEIIPPSIDAFSAKNRALDPRAIHTILVHVGLVEGPPPAGGSHGFVREDGSRGRVERRADVLRLGRAPAWDTPLVVQVSRWDPLKDMVGVMHGFARLIAEDRVGRADLVLAGPNVTAVADDPEGGRVFEEVLGEWRALPHAIRNRVHLASLPTADVEENAVIVNALQRHAAIIVQKSLAEGFGLTVTEAMWKARPVLASAVGGIQDQVRDGVDGVLLPDPADLGAFAEALGGLLRDPERAARLGESARERVRERYLGVRHLLAYAELFERLIRGGSPA
ncbi:MAG: glycosyltransferase [Myxococcota bacterium]|nr:glycosyltransferase [Myxococcota bacterium]